MQRDVIKIVTSVKECISEIKSNYTLIKFSTDVTKEKKFRNTYKVPLDEEILAHILKMAPLGLAILDGIIITNKALYINPKHCKNKSTNRIPLTELCKYILRTMMTKRRYSSSNLWIIDKKSSENLF